VNLFQAMHYLGVALDASCDVDKSKYAKALHSRAITCMNVLLQERYNEDGCRIDNTTETKSNDNGDQNDLMMWKARLGISLERHIERSKKLIGRSTSGSSPGPVDTSATWISTRASILGKMTYNSDVLKNILHDSMKQLNSPLLLYNEEEPLIVPKTNGEEAGENRKTTYLVSSDILKNIENLSSLESQVTNNIATGDWVNAYKTQKISVKENYSIYGMYHESTCNSISLLGLICESMFQWNDSVSLHRQSLGIRKDMLGLTHESTIRSMARLGVCLDKVCEEEEKNSKYRKKSNLKLLENNDVINEDDNNLLMDIQIQENLKFSKCLLIAASELHAKHVMAGISKTEHSLASGKRMTEELELLLKRRGEKH
jgi:hypothetical protein